MKFNQLLSIRKNSLRTKILLVLLATAIILITLELSLSSTVILRRFESLEKNEVITDMMRMRSLLEDRMEALNTRAIDWANCDDTYNFVADRNEEYVMANLRPSAAVYLDINLMAFIDQSRQIVHMLFVDLETAEAVPIPSGLSELLLGGPLGHHDSTESSIVGLVEYDGKAIMVSSRPILTSQDEGPVRGALVFGRLLDQSFVDSLSASAKMNLDSIVLSNGTALHDAGIPSELSPGIPTLVQPINDDYVEGYALFTDPFGQPVVLLTAQIPRDIYQEGQATVRNLILWSVVLVLFTTFTAVLLLELIVVRRLARLSNDVVDVGRSDTEKRVSISSSDEIAILGQNINRMLDALEGRAAELRLENAVNDSILATIPAAVALIDQGERVLKANQRFYNLFISDMREQTDIMLTAIPDVGSLSSQMRKVLIEKKRHSFKFKYNCNGAEKLISADIVPIGDRQLLLLRDVTEERSREDRLYLVDRLLSVGELAAGAAHELNNPLTGIIGFSQLLLEKDIPDDVREDLKLIYNEAQRAAAVTKDLLTFARGRPPMRQPNQINTIIEGVLKLRGYEQKANGIEVRKQLSPDLPEVMVDYSQMQQVFLNIIINAEFFMIEAHKKGTLTITTRRQNGRLKISFGDDGPGIAPENLSRIFDPFFTTKEAGKGTGLGLSICHGIVTEHGGQIYARSQPGKGTTIVVELPINDRDQIVAML